MCTCLCLFILFRKVQQCTIVFLSYPSRYKLRSLQEIFFSIDVNLFVSYPLKEISHSVHDPYFFLNLYTIILSSVSTIFLEDLLISLSSFSFFNKNKDFLYYKRDLIDKIKIFTRFMSRTHPLSHQLRKGTV